MPFDIGQRVRIRNTAIEFAGVLGTIAQPPDSVVALLDEYHTWITHFAIRTAPGASATVYYVVFDHPSDDGSGDGPYYSCTIDEDDLNPISPVASCPTPPHRSQRDHGM